MTRTAATRTLTRTTGTLGFGGSNVSSLARFLTVPFLACCAVPAGALPSFIGLGDVAGGDFSSRANGVSGDGKWVVGTATGPGGPVAFRWSLTAGLQELGAGTAHGVSDDGGVVVGGSAFGSGPEAYRWTQAGGMAPLGDLPGGSFWSKANAVSGDGSVVVGYGDSDHEVVYQGENRISAEEAFRWDATNGMVGLGIVSPGPFYNAFYSTASGISADGSIIAGTTSLESNDAPFFWTEPGGMQAECYECELVGTGISPDGTTLVGGVLHPSWGGAAFRWDFETDEIEFLPYIDDLDFSAALDASLGGELLVGFVGDRASGDTQAVIWHDSGNVTFLQDLLEDVYGLDLTGWVLEAATAVSYDGNTLVGYGINPDGYREAWIATIPEPATGALLAFGLALLALRRCQAPS